MQFFNKYLVIICIYVMLCYPPHHHSSFGFLHIIFCNRLVVISVLPFGFSFFLFYSRFFVVLFQSPHFFINSLYTSTLFLLLHFFRHSLSLLNFLQKSCFFFFVMFDANNTLCQSRDTTRLLSVARTMSLSIV